MWFAHFSVVALAGCKSYSLGLPHTLIGLYQDLKNLVHSIDPLLILN